MKINGRLLPVKAHYFFFMAASGPILPYLTVYGKQLGISEVVMGSITAVLPLMFLLSKPIFGFIVDYFHQQRKFVFMLLICSMSLFYVLLYFVPPSPHMEKSVSFADIPDLRPCRLSDINLDDLCSQETIKKAECNVTCPHQNGTYCQFSAIHIQKPNETESLCIDGNNTESCYRSNNFENCKIMCTTLDKEGCVYHTFIFYGFVTLMSLAMIAYNVGNSISDAICFDMLGEGEEMNYGRQRVWGAIGFGLTALLGGLGMDLWSGGDVKNYTPAFVLVIAFTFIDMICCLKLKLPKMGKSENILKDLGKVLKNKNIIIFLGFATLAGVLDSFIIYFMFWFLEDLALSSGQMGKIKLLEGLTVAAETLGGEVIFFPLSGKILEKVGYGHSLSICFFNYAIRLLLISLIPSPWWILGIELFMQGPTYALCYTTIVAYASAVSPPGTSATMQGLVAGMDDGFGYAVGSLIGGFLYQAIGGRLAFQCFSFTALVCCIAHVILYKFVLSKNNDQVSDQSQVKYLSPSDATQVTNQVDK